MRPSKQKYLLPILGLILLAFALLIFFVDHGEIPRALKAGFKPKKPDPTPPPIQKEGPPIPHVHTAFLLPKRISLYHVEGSSHEFSYGTNYSTVAAFFASEYQLGHFMPLVDVRGHRFDNDHYAFSVGTGFRYVPFDNTFCELLGFNVFYDWRQGHKGSFNQLGLGVEVLSSRWDFRANGYIPFGIRQVTTSRHCGHYTGGYYLIHRDCEYTSFGFNAEVGYLLVDNPVFFLYAAAGPYYLSRRSSNRTRGGTFRIRPQYKDYFAVDLSVSYDAVFHGIFQATAIVYLPLYQLSSRRDRNAPCGITDRQVYQPIERHEVTALGKSSCWKYNF